MSSQHAFDHALASLHDAALDETYLPAASRLIDEACGMTGNRLVIGEGPSDDMRVAFVGAYNRGQRRHELEREYLEKYHPRDERVPRIRRLPYSRIVHVTDLYTEQELKTSATYNEFSRRCGARNGLLARLDGPSGSHITWASNDPIGPGDWKSAQLEMIQRFMPHVRQFVRIRSALAGAKTLGASLGQLLGNNQVGVIYLDWRGRVVEANDRARDILRQGEGLLDRGGHLSASLAADRAMLERRLAQAIPAFGAQGVSVSISLGRSVGQQPLTLHVNPVAAPPMGFGTGRVAAVILVVDPENQAAIDSRQLPAALGLTRVESRVAALLAEGRSVSEIAVATGRQARSVRQVLERIYDKHGISNEAELVQLVLTAAKFGKPWN